jgi:hypothetical protein
MPRSRLEEDIMKQENRPTSNAFSKRTYGPVFSGASESIGISFAQKVVMNVKNKPLIRKTTPSMVCRSKLRFKLLGFCQEGN